MPQSLSNVTKSSIKLSMSQSAADLLFAFDTESSCEEIDGAAAELLARYAGEFVENLTGKAVNYNWERNKTISVQMRLEDFVVPISHNAKQYNRAKTTIEAKRALDEVKRIGVPKGIIDG